MIIFFNLPFDCMNLHAMAYSGMVFGILFFERFVLNCIYITYRGVLIAVSGTDSGHGLFFYGCGAEMVSRIQRGGMACGGVDASERLERW